MMRLRNLSSGFSCQNESKCWYVNSRAGAMYHDRDLITSNFGVLDNSEDR